MLDPPVCAAVAVSPALEIEEGGASIRPLALETFGPSLGIAFEEGNGQVAGNAARLAEELGGAEGPSGRREVTVLPVPGTDHSTALVENHEEVRGLIDRAVLSCRDRHRG
ncbi:hypothetical protein [Planomonospora algeriensis]